GRPGGSGPRCLEVPAELGQVGRAVPQPAELLLLGGGGRGVPDRLGLAHAAIVGTERDRRPGVDRAAAGEQGAEVAATRGDRPAVALQVGVGAGGAEDRAAAAGEGVAGPGGCCTGGGGLLVLAA